MNLKALITTLAIFGSSSVAMAQPVTYAASAQAAWTFGTGYPQVRDHRAPSRPVVSPPPARNGRLQFADSNFRNEYSREFTLAHDLVFNVGETRKDIIVDRSLGGFGQLHVDVSGRSTYLKEVRIEFLDGHVQSIPLDRAVYGGQSLTFNLDGRRPMNRIFLYRTDGGVGADPSHSSRAALTVSVW